MRFPPAGPLSQVGWVDAAKLVSFRPRGSNRPRSTEGTYCVVEKTRKNGEAAVAQASRKKRQSAWGKKGDEEQEEEEELQPWDTKEGDDDEFCSELLFKSSTVQIVVSALVRQRDGYLVSQIPNLLHAV